MVLVQLPGTSEASSGRGATIPPVSVNSIGDGEVSYACDLSTHSLRFLCLKLWARPGEEGLTQPHGLAAITVALPVSSPRLDANPFTHQMPFSALSNILPFTSRLLLATVPVLFVAPSLFLLPIAMAGAHCVSSGFPGAMTCLPAQPR